MKLVETYHTNAVQSRRIQCLAGWLSPLLPARGTVLDVGTGDGRLARAILGLRPDLTMRGIEFLPRPDCAIEVEPFDGRTIPFESNSFDAVLFADVLHHVTDPAQLLGEAVRVTRRSIVIKDHLVKGLLGAPTLRFMDDVGNRRFDVPVPGNYWHESQWRQAFERLHLDVSVWHSKLRMYPWWADWWFGRSLHFVARLDRATTLTESA